MAKMSEEDRAAFTDAYRYFESHWDMPDTVEAWEQCASEIGPLTEKYADSILISQLLMACYDTIDKRRAEIRRIINGATE